MSRVSTPSDCPVDALPDYVRGASPESEAIERHLADCEACRTELEILRALGSSGPDSLTDVERQRAYRGFEQRRARLEGARGGGHRPWLVRTWRAAAAIAVLLTSVGVWRVVQQAEMGADWNPEIALEGWAEDLADLEVAPGDVQMAFGSAAVSEPGWDELEGPDPYDLAAPWEEDR